MSNSCPASSRLTMLQQGMLYHWLKNPTSGVDIEQAVCTLPEDIQPSAMRAAWQMVVDRHAILRTSFTCEGETARQFISPSVSLACEEIDLSGHAKATQEAMLADFLHTDRMRGFDLAAVPLLRLTLFRLGEEDFRLVWTFHHALLDGRSITALLKEALENYDALDSRQAAPVRNDLPPFSDFVAWQEKLDFTASENYWKSHMSGFQGPTPTVVDHLAGVATECRQDEVDAYLSEAETASLRTLAEQTGVTLNAVVQAAWAILLSRYSGEQKVVFGATRACRYNTVPQAEEVAGLFINTIPIRPTVNPKSTLQEFLTALRQHWLDQRAHEHTPLPLIQKWAGLPSGQSLFNHLFVFERYEMNETLRALGGKWARRDFQLRELTNVPLTLAVYGGSRLRLHCHFDLSKFDRETITRMLGHLGMLLRGFVSRPDSQLENFLLLTESEQSLLHKDWNPRHPQIANDETLPGWFARTARLHRDRIAVSQDEVTWTYAELDQRATAVASSLLARGVQPGSFVGLCMERTPELVAAILGILKAGAAYLPIDLAYPADRLAFMLEDACAPVLLTQKSLADKLPAHEALTLFMEDIGPAEKPIPLPDCAPEDVAYVIYTSGSTGKPKGCCVTHRNVVRLMTATDKWYGFNEHDVWTLFHSTAFDFSVWELWGALLYGGRLAVVPFLTSRSPDDFYRLLSREKVTVLNQTPSAFRQLMAAEENVEEVLPLSLRYVIFGGEALEMQSIKPWFDRHGDQQPKLVNMYGITETTVHVTYRPLSRTDLRGGSVIGVPIPDLQVYILDQNRQPVPIGVPGEMWVGGAGLAKGYWNRPDLTAERFPRDFISGESGGRLYKTGDLARFLPGRDIEYLGRIDQQVKIRGFRIELGEIESVLCAHPSVKEAAVVARQDAPGEKRLCAYIIPGPVRPALEELRAHARTKLPDYMVPAAFVYLEKFPLTNNGKLDRAALPVPEMDRGTLTKGYVGPRTESEEKLCSIWSTVLRVPRVGVHDNFFELGGDSILSIRVISQARQAGLRISPRQFFEYLTIAELSAAIGDAIPVGAAAAPPAPIEAGDFPLLPIHHWFFEQRFADPHHWNQAFLFTVSERLNPEVLRKAVWELMRHHDALRLRFEEQDGHVRQVCDASPSDNVVVIYPLAEKAGGNLQEKLLEICQQAHKSLDFRLGPLLKVVYLDLGEDRPGRIFFAVHHLAVDGVSWSILLQDLELAYHQIAEGLPVQLTSNPATIAQAGHQLKRWATSREAMEQLPYWQSVCSHVGTKPTLPFDSSVPGPNTEESVETVAVSLSGEDTSALLHRVPAAYRTRINDILLAALGLAFARTTGQSALCLNMEGHGREDIYEPVDLSRTVGWFTSIFPVYLDLPASGEPGQTLKCVKENLRKIPCNGAGFGVLKYLVPSAGLPNGEPDLIFNYLGQFDQLTSGSELFAFAQEPSGEWHGSSCQRRYHLEIDAMVLHGRLQATWRFSRSLHAPQTIQKFGESFIQCLKELIAHCISGTGGGFTPSDFPLAKLTQSEIDKLAAASSDMEDVYPCSPMQTLFYGAAQTKPNAGFDQWACQINGPLDISSFRDAWSEVLGRHSILRSTFHSTGTERPVQVVHQVVAPSWHIEDWREIDASAGDSKWKEFLRADNARRNDLAAGPLSRFALIRVGEENWKFLWSVPDMQLDGWSWPVVFGEVSEIYRAYQTNRTPSLEPLKAYRDYIAWLERADEEAERSFWTEELKGVVAPTPVPVERVVKSSAAKRFANTSLQLEAALTEKLATFARSQSMTAGVLIQAAWALLLGRGAAGSEVVIGSAFSGRPADIPGVQSMVGPFVNNLPLRLHIAPDQSVSAFLRAVQRKLFSVTAHQFTALTQVQEFSEVPWSRRVFDNLVVFQNYSVDSELRNLGGGVMLSDFSGPIHTNYPLTLIVTPTTGWELSLVFQEGAVSEARAAIILQDMAELLRAIPDRPDATLQSLQEMCTLPPGVSNIEQALNFRAALRVAPRTETEKTIATVWSQAFGISDISVEDNFFDLGGQSLLMVRVHRRLRDALGRDFSLVHLFQHPTIAGLAAFINQGTPALTTTPSLASAARDRAAAARAAAASARQARPGCK